VGEENSDGGDLAFSLDKQNLPIRV
jgi:hypothetical protein